jgi:hypothetical protein
MPENFKYVWLVLHQGTLAGAIFSPDGVNNPSPELIGCVSAMPKTVIQTSMTMTLPAMTPCQYSSRRKKQL